MKNIAFYYESSEATGGVNRVASIIASALADRGYRVHIISRYGGKHGLFTDDKRIVFHELFSKFHSKYVTTFIEAIKLRRLVRREKIDVLISTGGIFFALARFSKTRHIVWDHVSFWHGNKAQQYFRRLSARKAEKIVTLTQENRNAFEKIKNKKAEILTIHNPVIFKPVKPIDTANKIVISLGYLGPQKGYDLLLEAWSMIEPTLRKEWKLRIAGGDEGDRAALEAFIEAHRLTEVELLGFRSDVAELLSQSSLYVMSSRWEGMPMVLLEAQACGLPIVSFDCKTGPSEILTEACGLLVEPENTAKLADALTRMMRDEALRSSASVHALENVKRFSLDKIANQWVSVIEQA